MSNGVLIGPLTDQHPASCMLQECEGQTYGQRALNRIPSLAWTMANSRVMASTAPLDAVSVSSALRQVEEIQAAYKRAEG